MRTRSGNNPVTAPRALPRSAVQTALAFAVLALALPALADTDPVAPISLRWSAPAGCPAESDVLAEVFRVLGGPPDFGSPRHLRAEGTILRKSDGAYRVHIVTDMGGAIGERDLSAPACAAVSKAAALIVALTFDPDALARKAPADARPPPPPVPVLPPAPPGSTAPVASGGASGTSAPSASAPTGAGTPALPPPAPGSAPSGAPPARASSPGRSAVEPPSTGAASPSPGPNTPREAGAPSFSSSVPVRFSMAPRVSASVGALPGAAVGIGGAAGVLVGRVRVELAGAYWPDRTTTLASGASGQFRLGVGEGRVCYRALARPVEVAPCLGFEIGQISAEGLGVKSPGTGKSLWIAPLVEGTVALPIDTHFAIRLDLGVAVPARRPVFVFSSGTTVYQSRPVVGRSTLGAEVRF